MDLLPNSLDHPHYSKPAGKLHLTDRRQCTKSAAPHAGGLRITRDDLQAFARTLERDFAELGDRYYLSLAPEPTVRVRGDRITVTFDIHKDE